MHTPCFYSFMYEYVYSLCMDMIIKHLDFILAYIQCIHTVLICDMYIEFPSLILLVNVFA